MDHARAVWNSEDATRVGANNNPEIDLTLTTPNVALNWSIAEQEAEPGSDHEVIGCEVLGGLPGSRDTSKGTTR